MANNSGYLGSVQCFDYKINKWNIFKNKLDAFFTVNRIIENKNCILLSYLSEETYELVRNLIHPKVLENETYEVIVKALDAHFEVKKCTFVELDNFYSATKSVDEGQEEWLARLRGLAAHCALGTAFDRVLRDRFILGQPDGPAKNRLFEQDETKLTVAGALQIAKQSECVSKMKSTTVGAGLKVKDEPLFRVSSGTRGGGAAAGQARRARRDADSAQSCEVCGMKNHLTRVCRYKNYTCQRCGQKGHLKKVCTENKKCHRVHNIKEEPESDSNSECEECKIFHMRYVNTDPFIVSVVVNQCKLQMELDSGSKRSVISEQLWTENFNKCKLQKSNLKFCFYDGHKIEPLGYLNAKIKYNNQIRKVKLFVVQNGGPPLLGRDFMASFGVTFSCLNHIDVNNNSDVNKLLQRYADLWKDELGLFKKLNVSLRLNSGAKPRFFKPRPVPFALKDKVETELTRLVDLGILIPVSYSRYGTPIVPVLKANGEIRICGDYALTINKDLEIDRYPLPRIEEVFAKLRGGDQYTKIDLKMAYNQLELNPSDHSQEITTISTSKGLFKYTRLVFGLANAPAIFQRAMETLLLGIDGVVCFLDDICVTGPTRESHLERLDEVLKRLQDAGLRLQKDKCEFFCDSVTYLGYVIDKNGLKSCPKKVEAINKLPLPTNVKDVKRVLGMVNYYRKFIPNASSILHPLHTLLRDESPWQWGAAQQSAYDAIKRELASGRVLAHFDPAARLVLSVDAGPAGLGAVLAQGPDGQERPLAFASRSLTASERNYSQVQKEATALVYGVKYFHQYLYGRAEPFVLKTDHKPLLAIFGKKNGISVMAASRLQRYAIYLSAYNYIIQYTPSEKNLVADFFSRAPTPLSFLDSDVTHEATDDDVSMMHFVGDGTLPVSIDNIKTATATDRILQTVMKYMTHGWPRRITCISVQPFLRCKTELEAGDGYLLRGHRVVIPSALRDKMLHELHRGHLGIVKTKSKARGRMWWPSIDFDIESTVGACSECSAQRAAPPRATPAAWPRPSAAWQRVHLDYLSVGQTVYLVVVDAYTKWLECLPMTGGTSTRSLISKLKNLFSRLGIPNTIVSDNDVKIKTAEFEQFCVANGIEHMTSPIYHPASNGQAENSVRTCKRMIKGILSRRGTSNLNDELLEYLFQYRNTTHCSTGASPAKLMYGREMRCRLDLIKPTKPVDRHALKKTDNSDSTKCRSFNVDDNVWLKHFIGRKPVWTSGIVRKKLGRRMYSVMMYTNSECVKRHIDQLLKFTGDPKNSASGSRARALSPSAFRAAATAPEPTPATQAPPVEDSPVNSPTLSPPRSPTAPLDSEESSLGDNSVHISENDNLGTDDEDEFSDAISREEEGAQIGSEPVRPTEWTTPRSPAPGDALPASSEPEPSHKLLAKTRSLRPRKDVNYKC